MSEESYVMVFGEVFSYTQIIKNEIAIEQLKKLIKRKNQYHFVGEDMIKKSELQEILDDEK